MTMKKNFILLLSVILFISCKVTHRTEADDLNSLKCPVVLIAKSRCSSMYHGIFYSIIVKTGNDSLVSYSGKDSEMIQSIGESFNINDTIR